MLSRPIGFLIYAKIKVIYKYFLCINCCYNTECYIPSWTLKVYIKITNVFQYLITEEPEKHFASFKINSIDHVYVDCKETLCQKFYCTCKFIYKMYVTKKYFRRNTF